MKTNISKNTHFRKSETGRYTNCCFKELQYKTLEHMLQGKQSKNCLHYTAKQDSIKTEIQVSGQLNDTERCFILPFQALYCCQPVIYWINVKRWDKQRSLSICSKEEGLLWKRNRSCPRGPKPPARQGRAGGRTYAWEGRKTAES